jgi:hypothetical protein
MVRRILRDVAVFAAFTVAVAAAALAGHPDDWLIGEDRVLETLSALLYAAAFLVGGATLLRAGRAAHRALWFIVPFGLVCALDEISFGARLFGFEAPALKGGGEFDGVHDLIILAKRELAALALGDLLLFTLAASVVALIAAVLLRRRIIAAMAATLADPVLLRLCACLGFLVFSQALDIDLVTLPKQMYLEEWGETSGGFWLFAAALAARLPAPERQQPRRPQAISATSPTATRMLYATTRNEAWPMRPNSAAPTRTKPSSTGTSSATFTSTSAVNSPPT